jgi:hypothetical protein
LFSVHGLMGVGGSIIYLAMTLNSFSYPFFEVRVFLPGVEKRK